MERRVRGNVHARCEVGENSEIVSKSYLSLFIIGIVIIFVVAMGAPLLINGLSAGVGA